MPKKTSSADNHLVGVIKRVHENGYGFVSVASDKQEYFVLKADLPAKAWVKGTKLRFIAKPPKPGTQCERVGLPEVLEIPELVS